MATPAQRCLLRVRALILIGLLALRAFIAIARAQAAGIPHAAEAHQRDLVREARLVWGLNAPVAGFAAQIHAESAWRPDAVSPVSASGLAQFMPATARWICGAYERSPRPQEARHQSVERISSADDLTDYLDP